ncbi:MAG: DUF6776 family protein [Sedimenticola sp.]
MKYNTPKITQGAGWRIKLLCAFLLSLPLLALLLYCRLNELDIGTEAGESALASEVELLRRQQVELQAERQTLRKQVAVHERSGQIDRETVVQLGDELKKEQQTRLALTQELSLLKRIVSSSVTTEGLYVQGFKLEKIVGADRYRYRFTISQALKDAGLATGWIYLGVAGERGEESVTLPLQELAKEGGKRLKMRFRHFQDVSGEIDLPKGFLPQSITVDIKPTNKKLPPLKKRFDWLLAG